MRIITYIVLLLAAVASTTHGQSVSSDEAYRRLADRQAARAGSTQPSALAIAEQDRERDDLTSLTLQTRHATTRPYIPIISLTNRVEDNRSYGGPAMWSGTGTASVQQTYSGVVIILLP